MSVQARSSPEFVATRKRTLRRGYVTIHDFAIALICLVHHKDADGREIGYDYGWIHQHIMQKFPHVTSSGPHKGKPTKMPFKELQKVTGELNRKGVKLPFRPRRKSKNKGPA